MDRRIVENKCKVSEQNFVLLCGKTGAIVCVLAQGL
jgi:hypothetical protein